MSEVKKTIWTVGHSTHSTETFISILKSFQIKVIVDVRSFPGSRRYPQFNKETLKESLALHGIQYVHLLNLGGKRKTNPQSQNTSWINMSFRGYADHMDTELFKQGIDNLEQIASTYNTAYMCAEAVWWKCHRSMISDYMKSIGWEVLHILNNKTSEHIYTKPAKLINGKLSYKKSMPLF